MNDLKLSKNKCIILDTTVFIRLDFPALIESKDFSHIEFKTVPSIIPELKDFRSKTNFNLMKESGLLKIQEPEAKILHKLIRKIRSIDPQTTLSLVDIDILALTIELNGSLMSNDLKIQNIAAHLGIPIKTLGGKRIDYLERWHLKCRSCGRISEVDSKSCNHCGGHLKKIRMKKKIL